MSDLNKSIKNFQQFTIWIQQYHQIQQINQKDQAQTNYQLDINNKDDLSIEDLQNCIKQMKKNEIQNQNTQINTAILQSRLGNYKESLNILEQINPFQQNIILIQVLKIQNLLQLQKFEQMQKEMDQLNIIKKNQIYSDQENFVSLLLLNLGYGFNKFELVFMESYFEFFITLKKLNKQQIQNRFQQLELDYSNLCDQIEQFVQYDPDKFNKLKVKYSELFQSVCYCNDNQAQNQIKHQKYAQNYLYFNNQGVHQYKLKNFFLAQKCFEKSLKMKYSLSALYNYDICNIQMNIFQVQEISLKNRQIGLHYYLQNFLFQNQQNLKKFISYQAVVQFSHPNKCFMKEKNQQVVNNEIQYLKLNIFKLKGLQILKSAKNLIIKPQNDFDRNYLTFINICYQNYHMANFYLDQIQQKSQISQIYQMICDFYTKGLVKDLKFQNILTIQGKQDEFHLFDKTEIQ